MSYEILKYLSRDEAAIDCITRAYSKLLAEHGMLIHNLSADLLRSRPRMPADLLFAYVVILASEELKLKETK